MAWSPLPLIQKKCRYCKKQFSTGYATRIYCSITCSTKKQQERARQRLKVHKRGSKCP